MAVRILCSLMLGFAGVGGLRILLGFLFGRGFLVGLVGLRLRGLRVAAMGVALVGTGALLVVGLAVGGDGVVAGAGASVVGSACGPA